jgi:hypothetical protein
MTGQSEPEVSNGDKSGQTLFANLPNHPDLEVTDENWPGDLNHLGQLGPEQVAGPYAIQLPAQAQSAHHLAKVMHARPAGYELDGAFVWKWPSPIPGRFYGVSFFYDSWEQEDGPSERELQFIQQGLLSPPAGISNRKVKRGRYRDLPAWLMTQETSHQGTHTYEIVIQAVDGEYNLGIQGFSPSPPSTPGYERVKAAMLSVHRRTKKRLGYFP